MVNGRIYKENSNLPIGNQFFSVSPESPLKQFKSGIPIEEIQCKEYLVLVRKHNGSPVCITTDNSRID
ncbi:MAG: hypothetical protein OEL81_06085 [Nitrosopumilus sp.]|nr:hypothetical protein [Nitrosopumilus sp.]